MIYVKTLIAGAVCAVAFVAFCHFVRYLRSVSSASSLVGHSLLFWAGVLLSFALGAGLYWEFHGITMWTAKPNGSAHSAPPDRM